MPPKPKYTKEEIVQAAFEIAKKSGIDAVVAREVAKHLGTTTGPIFTYFETMEELKEEVYLYVQRQCTEYFRDAMKYSPAFKEFGRRWICYAKEDPNLYMLLFVLRGIAKDECRINEELLKMLDLMTDEVKQDFGISQNDAKRMLQRMVIFAQGIASMIINNVVDFSQEELEYMMSEMSVSFALGCKVQDGTFDMEKAKLLYKKVGEPPERLCRK